MGKDKPWKTKRQKSME